MCYNLEILRKTTPNRKMGDKINVCTTLQVPSIHGLPSDENCGDGDPQTLRQKIVR